MSNKSVIAISNAAGTAAVCARASRPGGRVKLGE